MKTKHLILMLTVLCKVSFAQHDYFQWQKTFVYTAAVNAKVPGSGLAIDQSDRVFYVTPSGGNNRVFWQYGNLHASSPNAAGTSNMKHIQDPTGDHLFYISSSNQIAVTEYLYSNQNWSYNSNYSGTEPIAVGPSIAPEAMNKVYYIRASDYKVCNYYSSPFGSGFGPVIPSAPSAAPYSNLVLNNDRVFYITSNYQIGCLQFTYANGWQNIVLTNGPAVNGIAPGSKIQVRGDLTSFAVFYVGTNNKIYQYTNSPNYSGCNVISNDAPLAMTSTDILTHSYNEVRYVDTDGNVQDLFFTDCKWVYYTLNNSCNISDPSLVAGSNNKVFFYSNGSGNAFYRISNLSESSGFVYKKANKLMLGSNPFLTKGMNYVANIYSTNGGVTFFPGPDGHYSNIGTPAPNTQAACQNAFNQHLAEIAGLGFNSIRFNDFHLMSNPNDFTDPNLYISYWDPSFPWAPQPDKLVDAQTISALFSMYSYILNQCAMYNLKVKFFIGLENGHKNTNCMATYNNFLQQFAAYFQNNSTIYSYAILQEADVNTRIHATNTSAYRGKGDICYYVNNLCQTIRNNDPNHLVNLSVVSSDCVRNFDPATLNVDFMSFHIYPEAADNTHQRLKREILWASKVMKAVNKPWILGETSIPGNNQNTPLPGTVSYADQATFAQFILDEAFSAGASGVCWWQYRDVVWAADANSTCCADPYLSTYYPNTQYFDNTNNYYGLKAHDGSLKPAAEVFLNYVPQAGCIPMYLPENYYATLQNASFNYIGNVTNQNGDPLEDAQVLAINYNNGLSKGTFAQSNGAFNLNANINNVSAVYVTAIGYQTAYVYPPFNNTNVVLTPVVCGQGNARLMTSVDEETAETESGLILYPNPNNGVFTLKTDRVSTEPTLIEVTDVMGRAILTKTLEKVNDQKMDLSGFNTGVYFVRITSGDFTEVKKVIKK